MTSTSVPTPLSNLNAYLRLDSSKQQQQQPGGCPPAEAARCHPQRVRVEQRTLPARQVLPTLSHSVPVSGEPRGRVHIQPGATTDGITLDGLVCADILFLSRTRCC